MYKFRILRFCLLFLATVMITGCSEVKESREPGVLISTDWLQDHLQDPDVLILHSGTAELFDSIHIPGARLLIPSHFTVNSEGLRNELPPPDSLIKLFRSVGVNNDSRIVLYSENARLLTRTARIFLTLDHLGLGERTHFLDGGLPAWQEEERELSQQVPEIRPGNLLLPDLHEAIIKSAELDRQRWNDEWVLIDVRSDREYYGSPADGEEAPEGGHIEGAYFLPYQDLLLDDRPYFFKPDKQLEEIFRTVGMDREKKTVFYCGSGIRACASYLAARHLGYPVVLYDGAYGEWNDLDLPLTGPVDQPDNEY